MYFHRGWHLWTATTWAFRSCLTRVAGRFVSRITSFPQMPAHTHTSHRSLPGAVSRPVQYPQGGAGVTVRRSSVSVMPVRGNSTTRRSRRPAARSGLAGRPARRAGHVGIRRGGRRVGRPRPACDSGIRPSATPVLRVPDPVPVVFVEARDWLRGLLSGEPKKQAQPRRSLARDRAT
jgi:hypothetical protein